MGQAKRRGNYETRKAEAIKVGRIKPAELYRQVMAEKPKSVAAINPK